MPHLTLERGEKTNTHMQSHTYQRVKYGFLPEECSAVGNREMQRKKEASQNKTQLLGAGRETKLGPC